MPNNQFIRHLYLGNVCYNVNICKFRKMSVSEIKPKLSSHVYFCVFFTLLSFGFLPMVASLVAIVSGKAAMNEIKREPDKYRGYQLAQIGIYASYISAGIWLAIILSYVIMLISDGTNMV